MVTVQAVISTARGDPVGILEDIVIDPQRRRKGIGSVLLTAAVEKPRCSGAAGSPCCPTPPTPTPNISMNAMALFDQPWRL